MSLLMELCDLMTENPLLIVLTVVWLTVAVVGLNWATKK